MRVGGIYREREGKTFVGSFMLGRLVRSFFLSLSITLPNAFYPLFAIFSRWIKFFSKSNNDLTDDKVLLQFLKSKTIIICSRSTCSSVAFPGCFLFRKRASFATKICHSANLSFTFLNIYKRSFF